VLYLSDDSKGLPSVREISKKKPSGRWAEFEKEDCSSLSLEFSRNVGV
jgi:hypothetical protein